jgi:hypothetical protein
MLSLRLFGAAVRGVRIAKAAAPPVSKAIVERIVSAMFVARCTADQTPRSFTGLRRPLSERRRGKTNYDDNRRA